MICPFIANANDNCWYLLLLLLAAPGILLGNIAMYYMDKDLAEKNS